MGCLGWHRLNSVTLRCVRLVRFVTLGYFLIDYLSLYFVQSTNVMYLFNLHNSLNLFRLFYLFTLLSLILLISLISII
jgi:hypothetical protein